MSHQTGIQASDELKAVYAKCKSKREIRCIKLSIDKEKLVCDESKPMSAANGFDWMKDWSQYMVEGFLPKQKPCYVLFRLAGSPDKQSNIVVVPNSTPPTANQAPPPLPPKPSKPMSIVSKLTAPPKLASLLSSTLSNNNNNKSNNNVDKSAVKNDNLPNEATKDLWLFVSWTPDTSPVRDKMIYASTKSTVKNEFGGGSIFADYFVSSPDDLSIESVKKWINRKQQIREGHIDMNELSLNEQEWHHVKAEEAASAFTDAKSKSLPSIQMPISKEATAALEDFKLAKSSYVQLSIDSKTETILLERSVASSEFDLVKKSIASLTPRDHARYHLVSFSHQHNKKQTKATLFIYSIPSSGCSVKERMLYSSVKNSLLQMIQDEAKFGILVDRRIETDDSAELTASFLYEELYPPSPTQSPVSAIVKPKGPTKQNSSSSRRRVM